MNDLLVERFFLVAVELTDGSSTQLKARGETPAEAYKEVRARADVRRVGKVSEIREAAFHSEGPRSAVRPGMPEAKSTEPHQSDRGEEDRGQAGRRPLERHHDEAHQAANVPTTPREALIGFTISGPRVIRAAKPLGYEQPFKTFRARPGAVNQPPPPESRKRQFSPFGPVSGPVANDPSRPPVFAKPIPAGQDKTPAQPAILSPEVEPPDTDQADPSAMREYRIRKSRRQTGDPYLLQRGLWSMQKGKRVFAVEWEKGFPSRDKAEKQQAWLEQMARESAELQSTED